MFKLVEIDQKLDLPILSTPYDCQNSEYIHSYAIFYLSESQQLIMLGIALIFWVVLFTLPLIFFRKTNSSLSDFVILTH